MCNYEDYFCRSISNGAGVQPLNQPLLPAPPATNSAAPPAAVSPKIDLLSGDDYASPKAESSLALVPVGEPQLNSPAPSQQNALVLFDMFSESNNGQDSVTTTPANLRAQNTLLTQQFMHQPNLQASDAGFHPNGRVPNTGSSPYEQPLYTQGASPAWNGQLVQQQQPSSPVYGALLIYASNL